MDWHPMISIQQQTPDNDFCHFSISNVRFAFCAFKKNRKKTRVSHRVKMMTRWPGDPDVKDDPNDPLTRWPNDPVPCLPATQPNSASYTSISSMASFLATFVLLSLTTSLRVILHDGWLGLRQCLTREKNKRMCSDVTECTKCQKLIYVLASVRTCSRQVGTEDSESQTLLSTTTWNHQRHVTCFDYRHKHCLVLQVNGRRLLLVTYWIKFQM